MRQKQKLLLLLLKGIYAPNSTQQGEGDESKNDLFGMWCSLFLLFLLRSEYYWPSDVTNDDDRAFSFVLVVYLIIQISIKNLLMPSTVKKKKRKKGRTIFFFFFFFCLVVCWLRWIASALFPTVFPLLGASALHDDSKQRGHLPPWWWEQVQECGNVFVARSHRLYKEWRRRRRRYFSFFLSS